MVMTINLSNVLHNYKLLCDAADGAIVAAVVKNDAYGLGGAHIARHLYEFGGARDFFVANFEEAVALRPHVSDSRIYILGGIFSNQADKFLEHNLIPAISTLAQFEICTQHNIKCVVNLETGLNRLGMCENDIVQIPDAAREKISLVISHLACADDASHPLNAAQSERLTQLRDKYFPGAKLSLAASDGMFLGNEFRCYIVRAGAGLYGLHASPHQDSRLRPAVTIVAPILQITALRAGESAGYSATFTAPHDMRIAIIGIGYGDGMFRSLSNKGRVFIGGHPAPIIGRVSMDMIIVDVTQIDNVGDTAEILNDTYTADNMAADAGTNGYEILSRFGNTRRMTREYIL
ncbi:MAG: alanine racemase [Alphaproteobacteria bacterium]|nr:alanine racemase [Alphaproteobacteria bacterium]MCL2889871.1 alanine racemase [Alphaproteobacteria bacterium]